jgi:uncharacterized protein
MTPRFHLAIPVRDLSSTRAFYCELLGCREARSSANWMDFDFFGHQLSAHLCPTVSPTAVSDVDSHAVPIPHFGVILEWSAWHGLVQHLQDQAIEFVIAPTIRFQGLAGEQATMLFNDPSGNTLEFKSFQDDAQFLAG